VRALNVSGGRQEALRVLFVLGDASGRIWACFSGTRRPGALRPRGPASSRF
jgi:hypothetical protein